jgi:hypothetical protein
VGIGTIDSWNLLFMHDTGTVIVNRYGVVFDGHGGTDPNQRNTETITTAVTPTAAMIEVGYDQVGGQLFGVSFSQLIAQPPGSDSWRIKCEYRAIPLSPAE